MPLKEITTKNISELKEHICSGRSSIYLSSKTSTVIPYERLEKSLQDNDSTKELPTIVNLSLLPGKISIGSSDDVTISGAVTWQELKSYCQQHGRSIKAYPTEELALVLAGVATSCTGERSFGFGSLRRQVKTIKFLNWQGLEVQLSRDNKLESILKLNSSEQNLLAQYSNDFKIYRDFKNAPYPRFESEIDLMIGTEGQLGVITEVTMETTPLLPVTYIFIKLPNWQIDYTAHLEIQVAFNCLREQVFSCEFADYNSVKGLDEQFRLSSQEDLIFLEIHSDHFETIYEKVLSKLVHTSVDNIFEIPESRFHKIRAAIPRTLFETNERMGVDKKGTDVQVKSQDLKELLNFYRKGTKLGVAYNLFGHFGDAHLHFNFLPKPDQQEKCQRYILELYDEVHKWQGSPFAEHGIGLLKQKFITKFHGPNQLGLFKILKQRLDPNNQFFAHGFMNNES